MSRTSALILLGVLVVLVPFSGLPISIRNILAVVFGACVLGIGLMLRAREARSTQISSSDPISAAPAAPAAPESAPPSGVSPI